MEIQLNSTEYKGAFGTQPVHVFVKVKRDKPEYWPWERVLGVHFLVEKYPYDMGGAWYITSWTDTADRYMMAKFGTARLKCETRGDLLLKLEQIIPDWIGKDYSGGMEREFEFIY